VPVAERGAKEKAADMLWRARARVNLVIVAHADDAEMHFGAAMLRLIDAGEKVFIVVATDGALAGAAPRIPSRALAAARKKEQQEAARLAGVSGVFFLGFPDQGLQFRKAKLRERICYFIRKLRPEAVFTHDPTLFYLPADAGSGRIRDALNHPDHRAVGEAALDIVGFGCALDRCMPEHGHRGLSPWSVDDLYLTAAAQPNVVVDASSYRKRKKALLGVYRSQAIGDWIRRAGMPDETFRHIPCSAAAAQKRPRPSFFKRIVK